MKRSQARLLSTNKNDFGCLCQLLESIGASLFVLLRVLQRSPLEIAFTYGNGNLSARRLEATTTHDLWEMPHPCSLVYPTALWSLLVRYYPKMLARKTTNAQHFPQNEKQNDAKLFSFGLKDWSRTNKLVAWKDQDSLWISKM